MSTAGDTDPTVIRVDDRIGEVSAILRRPAHATALYVLAHGAGAGMRHVFVETMADRLASRAVATLRFQFPFTEASKRRPDPKPVLLATIAAAIEAARAHGLPLFAGGKSMGGRMSSHLLAEHDRGVRGLVFLGFPLHPAGKPGIARAEHLPRVRLPMLFVQGTRDSLANLALLRGVLEPLDTRAELYIVDGGDHGFAVPKRGEKTPDEAHDAIADAIAGFVRRHL